VSEQVRCPGCGLTLPKYEGPTHQRYIHASPGCWNVYTQVLAREYADAVLFGQVHRLTVDTYSVQHSGGAHPDKSIVGHLCGLHLVLERSIKAEAAGPLMKQVIDRVESWPHFEPPAVEWSLTIADVASAKSMADHIDAVRRWSAEVWKGWSASHAAIAGLVSRYAFK
jgi:uncharacterized protein DUF5946